MAGGRARLYALLGARLMTQVTPLLYGMGGVGAEIFALPNRLSFTLEFDKAFPLVSGTSRGSHVSADGGPARMLFGIAWYLGS